MEPMTREQWVKMGDQASRRRWASQHPLAWILEYQPTILLPGKGYIPFEPYPFQQEFLNCRDQYRAINKPRQCGISTTVAAEVAWEFDNVPGAQIMIISKDFEAAKNFHIYVMDILRSVRVNNPDAPVLIKTNQSETRNNKGARIISLAASKEAGRSFSPTHFVFDEAAFTVYDDDIWQAASSALAKTRGRATVISTPKGRTNLFYEIFAQTQREPDGSGGYFPPHKGFTVFNYGWWDVPDYNPHYFDMIKSKNAAEKESWIAKAKKEKWYRSVRPSKSRLQWEQEFEGKFDANTGAAFSTRSLERAFKRNTWCPEVIDPQGIITEWYSEGYKPGRIYETGIDLGRKGDPTVLKTYDVTDFDPNERNDEGYYLHPARMVDYKYIEAGTASWKDILNICKAHLKLWQAGSNHDGTGVGDVADDDLDGLSDEIIFTAKEKEHIVLRIQHAFDYGAVIIPKIPRVYREHQRYEWDDKHLQQDTVMANGLAIKRFYTGDSGVFLGFSKEDFMAGELTEVAA